MKRIVLSLGLGLSLITGVFAADNRLDNLNFEIVSILSPFQNEATAAQASVGALETNDESVLKIGLNAYYRKAGPQNLLELKLDNFSYDYGDGSAPTTILKGSVGFDLTKFLPQNLINYIFISGLDILKNLVNDYSQQYDDAASMRVVVTSTTQDSDGNYTGLSAIISAKIDLTQLPEDQPIENIFATDAVLAFTLNAKTGAVVDAYLVNNPSYSGLEALQKDLKEFLDKVLAQDEEVIANIQSYIKWLDDNASELVGNNNASIRSFIYKRLKV